MSGLIGAAALVGPDALAQNREAAMTPGEGFVTRFSGVVDDGAGAPAIDMNGVVGSIIDLRRLSGPPRGQHVADEIQHHPITAGQVGQVFGVALRTGLRAPRAPDIYVTATSAFGLHRTADGADWMAGMWGAGGGPGTVYVLRASTGYRPQIFTRVTLDGRFNTGASLGNIAYDQWNDQVFVSDLETGMIHRYAAANGSNSGRYDHGVEGRTNFVVADTGETGSLAPIPFDPSTSAAVDDCPSGDFSANPDCWNVADFRRRVWGLGVRRESTGNVRLYYATWSGKGFNNPDFDAAPEEERLNMVWSIGLTRSGAFDRNDIRQEFILPDFFADPENIAEHGFSHPVSDIAFEVCGSQTVMLVAERGGLRNLGLDALNPFASAGESRTLRYELDDNGVWVPVGRYDVGNYDRHDDGPPFVRANCAGGVDFGLGIRPETGQPDSQDTNNSVWITGDRLCSPQGPCFLISTGQWEDDAEVHGVQGIPEDAIAELVPEGAYEDYPATGAPPAVGLDQSYMIDTDINIDASGRIIPEEATRNDTTKIGDVEIYQLCAQPAVTPPPYRHTRSRTHRRFGSVPHSPALSHRRDGSQPPHSTSRSHLRFGSAPHSPALSHRRNGSQPPHSTRRSHLRFGSAPSHTRRMTHLRRGSVPHNDTISHRRQRSEPHSSLRSHYRRRSEHNPELSHSSARSHYKDGSRHNDKLSHAYRRSHNNEISHRKPRSDPHDNRRSHNSEISHRKPQSDHDSRRSHNNEISHRRPRSDPHDNRRTHQQYRSGSSTIPIPRNDQPPGEVDGRRQQPRGNVRRPRRLSEEDLRKLRQPQIAE